MVNPDRKGPGRYPSLSELYDRFNSLMGTLLTLRKSDRKLAQGYIPNVAEIGRGIQELDYQQEARENQPGRIMTDDEWERNEGDILKNLP